MTENAKSEGSAVATIIIPLYDDWAAAATLLKNLDTTLFDKQLPAEIVLVNDGSKCPLPEVLYNQKYSWLSRIGVVNLRRNLGHQRSITVGMYHVWKEARGKIVVIMDADGEDQPADVPRLIEAAKEHPNSVVFADRTRRSENIIFRLFYQIFTALFVLLTGKRVCGGNFSAFDSSMLSRLLTVSAVWNHYASAVISANFSIKTIPSRRGVRYGGRSKMNFSGLVIHGLSAISVFSEIAGLRILIFCTILIALSTAGIGVTIGIRFFTALAIPGWATYTTGLFGVILLQSVLISLVFIFIILSARNVSSFLPIRDVGLYIENTENIFVR